LANRSGSSTSHNDQAKSAIVTIKRQPPRVLNAGDSIYVPRGTIHRNQNLTDKPARAINLNITW
jgi:oxalate decarboxylase/phosphoglucose isomerase-like protein (cupin superfamily)